jgi:hypothetical protein
MRSPNRIQEAYRLSELYSFYLSDKEENTSYIITFKEFRSVLKDYIRIVFDNIFDGNIYYMPFGFGPLYVNKRKVIPGKRLSPNWSETKKYGKLIFHLNEHSNGYKYSFKWDKGGCRFRNGKFYRLEMARCKKRELAKSIKVDGKDYIADKS